MAFLGKSALHEIFKACSIYGSINKESDMEASKVHREYLIVFPL